MVNEDSAMRGTDPVIQARARVRGFAKRLLIPAPRGLGRLGKNARVYRPWRIDGGSISASGIAPPWTGTVG